jgi:hypothetical protein
MPRNTTGGSGHKAQRNSETSKEKNNREIIDTLLDDYANHENTQGVYVARITKRMGCGRMEVFYTDERKQEKQQIIALRGGLRGKGKKSVWVDVDSLVLVAETGLSGTTHEIVAVFSEAQVARFKKVKPDADPRLFIRGTSDTKDADDGFEFERHEETEEIDVDAI